MKKYLIIGITGGKIKRRKKKSMGGAVQPGDLWARQG
jgi:hypothetical protein